MEMDSDGYSLPKLSIRIKRVSRMMGMYRQIGALSGRFPAYVKRISSAEIIRENSHRLTKYPAGLYVCARELCLDG